MNVFSYIRSYPFSKFADINITRLMYVIEIRSHIRSYVRTEHVIYTLGCLDGGGPNFSFFPKFKSFISRPVHIVTRAQIRDHQP